MHEPIKLMAQGQVDYSVDAFPITSPEFGTMLTIGTEQGAIYVTKAQAMAFFGLIEPQVIYIDNAGQLISRVSSEQIDAVLGPHIGRIRPA